MNPGSSGWRASRDGWLASRRGRKFSRLAQTRPRRAALLLAGALVAFVIGRWSGSAVGPAAKKGSTAAVVQGRALVLDGDTIDVGGVRVRLFGIDAPERDQLCTQSDGSSYNCGQTARDALVVAIGSGMVRCARRDTDAYGRMVAVCSGENGDLGKALVGRGVALAYRHYSSDYVADENLARERLRGLWQGRFEAPWDHRDRKRRSSQKSAR